jgi:hypothetical protein
LPIICRNPVVGLAVPGGEVRSDLVPVLAPLPVDDIVGMMGRSDAAELGNLKSFRSAPGAGMITCWPADSAIGSSSVFRLGLVDADVGCGNGGENISPDEMLGPFFPKPSFRHRSDIFLEDPLAFSSALAV